MEEFPGKPIFDSRQVFAHDELKFLRSGKVRDLWEIAGVKKYMVIFATDRISAFDSILPTPVPGKGSLLNMLSNSWFHFFSPKHENHVASLYETPIRKSLEDHLIIFGDRIALVKKVKVIPVECVVRGYIYGSAWKAYQAGKPVCGLTLPKGLKEADRLPDPIFTPTTKAQEGHDVNLDEQALIEHIASWLENNQPVKVLRKMEAGEIAFILKKKSLSIYREAFIYAKKKGILLADTKFEFGLTDDGSIILIDELLTPDSSRFWPAENYQPGRKQLSLDKQFVRDYLDKIGWNHEPPAPELPKEVVERTQERYYEIGEKLFNIRPW